MPKKEIPSDQATDLRRQAENSIKGKTIRMPENSEALSPEYMRQTLHELQVHQIELEMQNEELRQTQAELEASRTRYFDLYDLAPVGYFSLSKEGLIMEINLTAATMLGVARSALIKKPLTRFILPEDHGIYYGHSKLLFKTGAPQVCELRMVRVDAAPCWVRIDAIAGEDADGTPICRATMIDVTERKRGEEALRESEKLFRSYLENAPDAAYLSDLEGNFIYGNRKCEEIIGYLREELIGKNILELNILPEKSINKAAQLLQANIEGKSTGPDEIELISKEGRIIPVEISTSVVQRMGQPIVLGFVRDITERKRAEETLKEKEKFMKSIVQSSAIATFVINAEHKVLYWNGACEDLTGIKSEDLLGTSDHWKAFYDHPRPCVADVIIDNKFNEMINFYKVYERSVLIPDGIRAEGWYPHLGGKNRYIVFDAAPIRDDNGKLIAAIETLQDITKRKRAEEACRNAEERYRTLFEQSPNGILLIDTETGKTIESNETAHKQLGYTREEFAALRVSDYEVLETPEETAKHIQKIIQGGIDDFETQHRTKSGEIRNVHVWAKAVQLSDHSCIYTILQDITEHRYAEKQLQDTLESLRKSFAATIQVMVSAVESRDPYTAGHQTRSADLARAIATEMGLPQDTIEGLRMAGSIHDIGKLSIPAEILSKPTKLTNLEFSLIKEHARTGYEMLKDVESPWPLAQIVYQHHERMDGSGYPQHLKGEEILIEARILMVADVVEAMASHRPYRPGLGIDAALNEIEKNRGIFYDEAVADACLRLFREKGFKLEGHDYRW